jgi:hypothetical protein
LRASAFTTDSQNGKLPTMPAAMVIPGASTNGRLPRVGVEPAARPGAAASSRTAIGLPLADNRLAVPTFRTL